MMIQTDPVRKFAECSEKGKLEEIRFSERADRRQEWARRCRFLESRKKRQENKGKIGQSW